MQICNGTYEQNIGMSTERKWRQKKVLFHSYSGKIHFGKIIRRFETQLAWKLDRSYSLATYFNIKYHSKDVIG
jgi:hypothetical protein